MEVFLFHAPGIGQDYHAEGPIRLYHSPGLLSMKPPVRQTDPVGTLHQLWASKLMLRSWLRPHLPKAMATVASGPPRSLQDEGVNLTVGGLGWEAS